jgi:hypothetical protein
MVECQLPKLKVAGSIPVARSRFLRASSLVSDLVYKNMKRVSAAILMFCLLSINGFGYGQRGHALVGAIADLRLTTNKVAAARVTKLLDGLTLAEVANVADSIKGWDDCKGSSGQFTVAGGPRINNELRSFVQANPCDGKPNHHQFHYTDVPLAGNEKYKGGTIGRNDFDVVHMIAYCIRVLADKEAQPNDRRITKSVAIILLAHYLGDIHQPLHVGAEYFGDDGIPFEPASDKKGHGDQGGNKLSLFLYIDGKERSFGGLHSYWDTKVVEDAFGSTSNSELAMNLAKTEPSSWKLTGSPESLSEQMADEIIPIAREAHARLVYSNVRVEKGGSDITSGKALERGVDGQSSYATWSQSVVKNEIHKAGWRLAAILIQLFK